MDTNTPITPLANANIDAGRHRTSLELWFADLGLEVTEVERCPDWSCEICADAEAMPVEKRGRQPSAAAAAA